MAGYGTDQGFTDWLAANGYAMPAGAPTPAVLRERGSVYIDATYGARFKGQPAGGYAQERAWPRTGAMVMGSMVPNDAIPLAVEHASYRAAFQIATDPNSLTWIGSAAGIVKRERVEGAVEVEYFDPARASDVPFDPLAPSTSTPTISEIDGMLAPYLDLAVPTIGIWSVGR